MNASSRFSTKPVSILSILGLILVTAAGCAHAGPEQAGTAPSEEGAAVDPPGTLYSTVDGAAVAALIHVVATTRRDDLDRLQVGSILAVDGGFTWQGSASSTASRRDDWRPKASLSFTQDHVATFVIHPRTGHRSLDRANEKLTRGERRIVDELDPLHRPIYLLTPSGRIVTYAHGERTSEIADLRTSRRNTNLPRLASEESPVAIDVELAGGVNLP
jgi:hypothetical protein